MIKRYTFATLMAILSLPMIAASEDVDMTPPTPPTPSEPETFPPDKRMPARKPVVTITDGTLLTVSSVAEDASLLIEILRDGEPFFSTYTMEHSVAIPYLEPGHTYTINLTVNGTLWTGTYGD